MNHRPVCVKCQVEMRPEKNGVGVLDMANFGPYKIWEADKWRCPECGYEVIAGFGKEAIAEHYQDSFGRIVEVYKEQRNLVKSRQYIEGGAIE